MWWIVHDGDLLLLVAHLLRKHRIWRGCKLRIYMVAEPSDAGTQEQLQRGLEELVNDVRIDAEVNVVTVEAVSLAPYVHALVQPCWLGALTGQGCVENHLQVLTRLDDEAGGTPTPAGSVGRGDGCVSGRCSTAV